MKKYQGNRSLKDIKRMIMEKGGGYDQAAYKGGSDYITLNFVHDNVSRLVAYNTFNGTFLIRQDDGSFITERSKEMDGTLWYDELLDILYRPLGVKNEGAAA